MTFELHDRLRNNEYTGSNRCYPCTIANVIISATVSVIIYNFHSFMLAFAIFSASIFTIYYRGYLIPKTPELTKRYFPRAILRLFGKDNIGAANLSDSADLLIDWNILVPCDREQDLCISDNFLSLWMSQYNNEGYKDSIEQNLDDLFLSIEHPKLIHDETSVFVLDENDEPLISRISTTALALDLGGNSVLKSKVNDWRGLTPSQKSDILQTLRLFLQNCPNCGSQLELNEDVRESCCSTHDVYVLKCNNCSTEIAETPA